MEHLEVSIFLGGTALLFLELDDDFFPEDVLLHLDLLALPDLLVLPGLLCFDIGVSTSGASLDSSGSVGVSLVSKQDVPSSIAAMMIPMTARMIQKMQQPLQQLEPPLLDLIGPIPLVIGPIALIDVGLGATSMMWDAEGGAKLGPPTDGQPEGAKLGNLGCDMDLREEEDGPCRDAEGPKALLHGVGHRFVMVRFRVTGEELVPDLDALALGTLRSFLDLRVGTNFDPDWDLDLDLDLDFSKHK